MAERILEKDFVNRIVTLLVRSGLTDLPKSERDRQILFKSATLKFTPGVELTEGKVNELLGYWSAHIAGLTNYDYISLRRALVDYGYLERSSDGATYMLSSTGPGNWEFEAAIDEIDLEATLETARQEIEAKKRAYLEKAKKKEQN